MDLIREYYYITYVSITNSSLGCVIIQQPICSDGFDLVRAYRKLNTDLSGGVIIKSWDKVSEKRYLEFCAFTTALMTPEVPIKMKGLTLVKE